MQRLLYCGGPLHKAHYRRKPRGDLLCDLVAGCDTTGKPSFGRNLQVLAI